MEAEASLSAELKTTLYRRLLDEKVGTQTIETLAAQLVAERTEGKRGRRRRRNAEVGRRRRGDPWLPKPGCARDPWMVRVILERKLKDARAHDTALKVDFKYLMRERLSELSKEERERVTRELHSRRDKQVRGRDPDCNSQDEMEHDGR